MQVIRVNSFVFITPFSWLLRAFLSTRAEGDESCADAMKFLYKLVTGDPPHSRAIGNSILGEIARSQNGRTQIAMLVQSARCLYDLHEITADVLAITINGVTYHLGTATVCMIDMSRGPACVPIDRVVEGSDDYARDLSKGPEPVSPPPAADDEYDDDDDASWGSELLMMAPRDKPPELAPQRRAVSTYDDEDDDCEFDEFGVHVDQRHRLCMQREVTEEDIRRICCVNEPVRVNAQMYAQFGKSERNNKIFTTYRGVSGSIIFTGDGGSKQILFVGRDSTIVSYVVGARAHFDARVGTIACRRA